MAKPGKKKLSPKQALFVQEYLIDLNASAAARRAGYKPDWIKYNATKILTNTNVQAAIQTAINKRAQRTEITQDYVLKEIQSVFEDAKREAENGMQDRTNALKALEMLAKHVGLYEKDNIQRQPQIVIKPPDIQKPGESGK